MIWQIVQYQTSRGDKPIGAFVASLDSSTQVKTLRGIDLLSEYGPSVGPPYSKKITCELYELRIRGVSNIRILYAIAGNKVFLLNAFKKKTQKLSKKELALAQKRLHRFIDEIY